LFDRLVLFGGVPVNALQRGDEVQSLGVPNADGSGVGDAMLGARVLLTKPEREGFAFAIQADGTFPLARAAQPSQRYTGDAKPTLHTQAIAHYQVGPFRVALNLGYRLRASQRFAALDIGDELTYGLGARLAVAERSALLAELHGTTNRS